MNTIVLDASNWRSKIDLYDALLPAIGAPPWHGKSIDALVDTMIYGGVNAITSPYLVLIRGTKSIPEDVRTHILQLKQALSTAAPSQDSNGNDVDVLVEVQD